MPQRETTTIRDVAARAGVSIATVSRVLNRYPHVRPEVRARVQQAIAAAEESSRVGGASKGTTTDAGADVPPAE